MNRVLYLLFFLLFSISTCVHAQGIEFFQGSWDEAVLEAQKQEKMIFLDAYASWCGPCKRMQHALFPQEKVGDFFNTHFINFKQDMEKGEGLTLRRKYPVTAYPTLFFISPAGEVVQKTRGAPRTADALISVANQAVAKYDPTAKFAAKYEEGDRSYETVINYVKALNKAGKSSVRVANEYLDSQDDISSPENLLFILEACTRTDSKIYDYLIEHQKAVEKLTSEKIVEDKIMTAAWNTVAVAVEFESPMLLEQTQEKIAAALPSRAERFTTESSLTFYKSIGEADTYYNHARDLAKMEDSPEVLHEMAKDILENFAGHEKAMKQAEKWAEEAAEERKHQSYYATYLRILLANGKESQANKLLDELIEDAMENDKPYDEYKQLKNEIGT